MTRPNQGLSSLAPGGKMRDPGNEVGEPGAAERASIKIYLQYSPKIMHTQELLFASARSSSCGSLELEFWKPQELLCGTMFEPQ